MPHTLVRTIPFFNYSALFARQPQEILATVERVLRGGKFILQEDLAAFEVHLAEYVGVRHAVGTGNGTDGLLLSLLAAGVGPGDEVILPSHTFVATGAAVHYAGATPVLVDCGDDHLVDPGAVRAAITSRTRVILPVHLNGRVCEMETLVTVAEEFELLVIEDAAQGLGAAYRGRNAGTFGRAGMFSFYPAKILGCFGDGGAVVTDDDELANRVRALRNHGRTDDGDVRGWSLNSRLDNLQAALLDLRLRSLAVELERRRQIARLYQERLGHLTDLRLPPGPGDDPQRYDVYQNYEVEAERRDALRAHLAEHGVQTVLQWGGRAIHQFAALGFRVRLPVTERVMARSFLLPMNTSLSDEDVEYICERIDEFYRG